MRAYFYNQTSSVVPSHGSWVDPSNFITEAQSDVCVRAQMPHSALKLTELSHFPKSVDIQAEMVAENVLPKLRALLASGSEDVRRASIALLWILSEHPHNQVGEVIFQD